MKRYLQACEIIDWQHPDVTAQARILAGDSQNDADIAKACFKFVRDKIEHSWDYQRNVTTCRASEVLAQKCGWCYAKSHLLAALLRANNIPTGLCYQRLTIDGDQGPYCLHGLNAIYLQHHGWYRVDARGNNDNVDAQFCLPTERLAYPIQHPGEADLNGIYDEPLPQVVQALRLHADCLQMRQNLPDIELY